MNTPSLPTIRKFATLGAAVFASAGVFAVPEWDDPQVNAINREEARAYSMPLADVKAALDAGAAGVVIRNADLSAPGGTELKL